MATKDKLQELVAMIVERVETKEQRVAQVIWSPPARPFFQDSAVGATALSERPRTDSNRRRQP